MNKRIVGLWVRIGVAALSTLLAVQATTGKASASVQGVTIDSITRTSLTTIQVSGTATFDAGDQNANVHGTLAQGVRSGAWIDGEGIWIGDTGSQTYNWTLTFFNPFGWKAGPATLSITAETFDPNLNQGTQQTKSGRVILPK